MTFNQTNNNAGDVVNVGPTPLGPVTVNINTLATVRLTPFGLKILVDHWAKLGLAPLGLTDTSTLEVPLWDLMHTFGPYLYMGAPQMPFVHNDIRLRESTDITS